MSGRNAKLCRRIAAYYRARFSTPATLHQIKAKFLRSSQREKASLRKEAGR